MGLRDWVEFTGHVDDPAAQLRQFTVCVHASPVPEPFGQVVVEAMAAGIPVVATDSGGVSEIIREGGQLLAWPVSPGCPYELAMEIGRVLEHPEQAFGLAARARQSVLRRFDIEQTAAQIMNSWDSARRRRRTPIDESGALGGTG